MIFLTVCYVYFNLICTIPVGKLSVACWSSGKGPPSDRNLIISKLLRGYRMRSVLKAGLFVCIEVVCDLWLCTQ